MPRIPKVPKAMAGDVEAACHTYLETKEAAQRHADACKVLRGLKTFALNDGDPRGAAKCGRHLITFSFSAGTRYDMPAEVKAPYKKTDPRGRFSFGVVDSGKGG